MTADMTPEKRNALQAQMNEKSRLCQQYLAQGDPQKSLDIATEVWTQHQIAGARADMALALLRLNRFDESEAIYVECIANSPNDPNLWDGLTEVLHSNNKVEKAREAGVRALDIKDAQTKDRAAHELGELKPFNREKAQENIISFSLFGANPRYCESAILNVVEAKKHLPEWLCRFYVDDSVPADVITRLRMAGGDIRLVDERLREISPLMWRFDVLSDPSVNRYLLRDADSVISEKEAAAVNVWLLSGKHFHAMRDYYSHTEPLLAGMWAGCGGVFKDIIADMKAFIASGNYLGARVVDQHFLRFCVWPTAKKSLLMHDSFFGWAGGIPFPGKFDIPWFAGGQFHVGANLSSAFIGSQTPIQQGELVWHLVNQNGDEQLSYKVDIVNGQWRSDIPGYLVKKVKESGWLIKIKSISDQV